jgi:branched-chain amino acid transport system ATP-binding protein
MTNEVAPLLTAENLRVHYGHARALSDVSFELASGSAIAVLGANGAGKTTLARVLAGLVRPTTGSVVFDGQDLTKLSPHRIARLGVAWVPEGRGIFPGLSVQDNLRARLRHATSRGRRDEALDHAYGLFPVLRERRNQRAVTLSGGEQQMLSLARVLAVPPRLLIADEMSLGLAPLVVAAIFDGLERARSEGVAIVLIEQFIDKALGFSDHALILRRGEVSWRGPATEAGPEVLDAYLGALTGDQPSLH